MFGYRAFRILTAISSVVAASLTTGIAAHATTGPSVAPGWEVFGSFSPTYLPPGGEGVLRLYVYDIGAGAGDGTGLTVTDELPTGLEATAEYPEGASPVSETPGCSGTTIVTCVVPEAGPNPEPEVVYIPVRIASTANNAERPVDRASVKGGGAPESAEAEIPVVFGSGLAPAGFANADFWVSNADGTIDTQAGSHPYAFTMMFTTGAQDGEGFELPSGPEGQALNVNLPPGFVGQPSSIPECPRRLFDGEECPADTQIGEDLAAIGGFGLTHAGNVYNMVPPPGVAAQFAFTYNGTHVLLDAKVRSGGNYGITVHANLPQLGVLFNTITIWGVPGEHGTGAQPSPFLTLPTACGAPPSITAEMVGTWQHPKQVIPPVDLSWHDNHGSPVGITGCERLVHFDPSIDLSPDTSFSDSAAGLTARVRVPQGLNPGGLASPGVKETTVVLPDGLAVNPARATGLAACSLVQANLPADGQNGESEVFDGPPLCPAASKIGTDEIETPLLRERLKGDVFVLQSNPPDVQLLVVASGEGVSLKLVGTVHLDRTTGQISATFKGTKQYPGTPDAPVDEFVLSFDGGAQAALITPATCGVYRSTADFTPWSSPFIEDVLDTSRFQITAGPGGSSACTAPLPFSPTLVAGSSTPQAGGYTDFSMLLQRPDGQQRVTGLQLEAPAGLSAVLSGVPLCPEPLADDGDCPSDSEIGHTIAGAGAGPYPFFLPQAGQPAAPIYITGPHSGGPFGLSIVVPLIAGPFDLGRRVIRASVAIDPRTAQIIVKTDPSGPHSIPTILSGVPVDLRSIYAVIDRRKFMFNATDCNPANVDGTATSDRSSTASLSYKFQLGSCQALRFHPTFKVSASAKTSRKNGAGLDFKVTYPKGGADSSQATSQANIRFAKVELPRALPSRLTTLHKACVAAVFDANPADCAATSIVGHATAVTPVLPVPLTGPAYFVSHGNEAFPSLIVVLQGYGVTVELEAATFISRRGITSSTFKQVPDVPVTSFELRLPAGPHSALAAIGDLCRKKTILPTEFIGHNNIRIVEKTKLGVTGCRKNRRARARRHASRALAESPRA